MGNEHEGNTANERNRRKILGRIVGKLFVDRDCDCQRRSAAHHQRVSIGGGFRDRGGSNDRGRSRPVFDDDGLAQAIRKLRPEDAAERVDRTASGPRCDERDRPRRVILGLRKRNGVSLRRAPPCVMRALGEDIGVCLTRRRGLP
jgi:hypothetical protein